MHTIDTTKPVRTGSKMSYVGALRVIAWRSVGRTARAGHGWLAVLTYPAAALTALALSVLLLLLWAAVSVWYVLLIPFGLLVFPYRLHMRSQRRQAATQAAMLAEMRASRRDSN